MSSRCVAAFGMVSWIVVASTAAFGDDPVAVLVTGPLTASVGERVSFEVEVVNR